MKSENIFILLFNGFSDWEISYLTPELNKSEKCKIRYFSIDGSEITSMGGLKVKPDLSLEDIEISEVSALVLPGGEAWEKNEIKGINILIQNLNVDKKIIAAICTGTTFLGQHGYLDNISHTSNDINYLKAIAQNYKGENNYENTTAVTGENIITANGTAPLEFAREIFAKINLYSEKDIEKWFQLFKNGIWTE
ncbi:type 1 glutamine amidotransferase family protein [Xanthovirga aplysinae]|uniref:type 1 glutamine amidotransferase family protein n=1 Tax=Xanthovirga aplysinae TaxID=2529853 RepID=UPI0012BC479B|nr:type 1 glutamine amidotransferase family protein [Xanthovirga aplysinae]MTI33019.1 glutamine amidotransferase [Xanthovirga aplysinae]